MKRKLDPIKPQTPDTRQIACMNCEYRDKMVFRLNGKLLRVGATKMYCSEYPDGTGKPYDVLFRNTQCERYKKENV